MNSCCTTPKFRSLFKMQEIYQTGLCKKWDQAYLSEKWTAFLLHCHFFKWFSALPPAFNQEPISIFQLLSVPIPAAGAIFKNVTLVQQVIKNGISNDTATEKIIRGWNSFLQQQALIFQQSARTYSAPFKNELQQQLIRYLYRYQYRKHSGNPPFHFFIPYTWKYRESSYLPGRKKNEQQQGGILQTFSTSLQLLKNKETSSHFSAFPLHFSKLAFCEKKRKRQQEFKITPFFEN